MKGRELETAIEAVLFASGEPVSAEHLARVLDVEPELIDEGAKALSDYYSFERRGIRLLKLEDSYQLCSSGEYSEIIGAALESRKPNKLSQSALEVLTIVAYYQPATRAYIEQIRGVDSSYTVGRLQNMGFIEECGRLPVPGRPLQYKTSSEFLRTFGLSSLKELPELPKLVMDDIYTEAEARITRTAEDEQ